LIGVAVLSAVVATPGVWLWQRWARGPLYEGPMPVPNGYDDLIAAGKLVRAQPPAQGDFRKATIDELRAWVGSNAEAAERVRLGLGRESRVRLPDSLLPQSRMDDVGHLRQVGRLLTAEAELAARDGRPADSARVSLDALKLARGVAHGGIILDRQVGDAVGMVALPGFIRVIPDLPADDCRRLLTALEPLDRSRETVDKVIGRDMAFTRLRSGWKETVFMTLAPGMVKQMQQPYQDITRLQDRRSVACLRILAANLALRAYRLEHPAAPVPPALDALAPGYLSAVPADPFGTGPLRMKAQGDSPLVYSVGPDGVDDGGAPIPVRGFTAQAKGDVTIWNGEQADQGKPATKAE
jgi:hypothetical protein